MRAQLALTERRVAIGLPWIAVALLALLIGLGSASDARLAVAVVGSLGLGLLVIDRRMTLLMPAALLALAWGSSVLPGAGSIAFVAKFGVLAATGATLVPWLVSRRQEHVPIPVAFGAAFLGLIAYAVLSVSWSVVPSTSLAKAASISLVWIAVVLAIPLWAREAMDMEKVLRACASWSAAFVAVGLALSVTHLIGGFLYYGRFNGLLNDANQTGYWMAPLLPPLVLMAAKDPSGRSRAVKVLLVAAAFAAIGLSGSRGGATAEVAGILVGLIVAGATRQVRHARRSLALIGFGVLIAAIAFPLLGVRLRESGQGNLEGFFQIGTGSNRITAWADALPLIADDPLLGHGFGSTPALFPSQQNAALQAQVLGRAQNSYLEAGIDLGWTGAVWLSLLALSGALAAYRVARRPGQDQALATMLLAGIVGGIVEGVFESGMLAAGGLLALPFWTVVAMAHVLLVIQTNRDRAASVRQRA